ncbi:hypothetical protein EON73_04210, partial [bacterium]
MNFTCLKPVKTIIFSKKTMETVSPNLYVKDLQETISFYKILGFQVITEVPDDGNPIFALMMNG